MKLSKLYCTEEDVFEDIVFNEKLNIVLAEIRKPENKKKSSHCLGKSTLASLIDYCLLKQVGKDYFLKKHKMFESFVFFIEIKVNSNTYITIRRAVKAKSKIAVKRHSSGLKDLRDMPDDRWDFVGGIDKAKKLINEILSFDVLLDRQYRESLGFFIRSPEGFNNVFRLPKYMQSNDVDWKPLIAELLGYESSSLKSKYTKDKQLDAITSDLNNIIQNEYESSIQEERLKVILSLKTEELERKEKQYDSFNFTEADVEKPEMLATKIDEQISNLIKENYYLKNKIEHAKKSIINYEFDLVELKSYYKEIGIYFGEQLEKDYSDLIRFNKEILSERNEILQEMLDEYTEIYERNKSSLIELNEEKSKILRYINTSHSFDKFKLLQHEITDLKIQIESIKTKINKIDTAAELIEKKNNLELDIKNIVASIKQEIFSEGNQTIESIRKHFNYILMETLGDAGVISTPLNKNNNVEFIAEIVDMNTSQLSSKDKGTTYKKLMCCAFDLAVLATYSDRNYIHFVYHDGVFDGLDSRQKDNFYNIINEYCSKYNIQYVFATIQDELPESIRKLEKIEEIKKTRVIIKTLHDEGDSGRLFRMEAF